MNSNDIFMQLQSLWVKQEVSANMERNMVPQVNSVTKKLKALQASQDRVNRVKMLVICLIFMAIVYGLVRNNVKSVFAYAGILIVFIGTVAFMFTYLKRQLMVSKLDFSIQTAEFARVAMGFLRRQNSIFEMPFAYYVLSILIGLNVFFFGVLGEAGLSERLQIHSAFSLWVLLVAFIGRMLRKRRIRKEVQPLMNDLENVRESFNRKNS